MAKPKKTQSRPKPPHPFEPTALPEKLAPLYKDRDFDHDDPYSRAHEDLSHDIGLLLRKVRALSRADLVALLSSALENRDEHLEDFVENHGTVRQSRDPANPPELYEEVTAFTAAALGGAYYEEWEPNPGSPVFRGLADDFRTRFDHLLRRVYAAKVGSDRRRREMFELLFRVLRRLDEGIDNIIFFDDDALGSTHLPFQWDVILPAYFATLAATSEPSEFAREVLAAIADFAPEAEVVLRRDAANRASRSQRLALERAALLVKPARRSQRAPRGRPRAA
ncbi:MAG: hypothetical protein U0414_31775 [Polyangiaceae bacterium]